MRAQLRDAHDRLSAMGIEAFAERARRELRATGETACERTSQTRDDLTAQELQIGRLAGDGLSNQQIGARLFISPRTVEWHLRTHRRVAPAQGLREARHQLACRAALPEEPAGPRAER